MQLLTHIRNLAGQAARMKAVNLEEGVDVNGDDFEEMMEEERRIKTMIVNYGQVSQGLPK